MGSTTRVDRLAEPVLDGPSHWASAFRPMLLNRLTRGTAAFFAAAFLSAAGPSQAHAEDWLGITDGWGMDLGSVRRDGSFATASIMITTVPQRSSPIPWDYVIFDARFDCNTETVLFTEKVFHTVTPLRQIPFGLPEPEVAVSTGPQSVARALNLACGRETPPTYVVRVSSAREFYDRELARSRR